MNTPVCVGIDVAQSQLDVVVRPGARFAVSNDEPGRATLVAQLCRLAPVRMVLEATGGLKCPSRRTRRRQRQLVDMRTAEKNRLRMAVPSIRKSLRTHRAWLHRERTPIDTELAQAIQDSPVWREKDTLRRSVPGVGPVLTTTVLANLLEWGTLTNTKIAALVGVAPLNCDSGTRHGKRMVWGGRAQVRATLSMAAGVATRYNPVIKTFYQRLCGLGKAKKVAFVACMRNLLTMLNAMLTHRTRWRMEPPQHA